MFKDSIYGREVKDMFDNTGRHNFCPPSNSSLFRVIRIRRFRIWSPFCQIGSSFLGNWTFVILRQWVHSGIFIFGHYDSKFMKISWHMLLWPDQCWVEYHLNWISNFQVIRVSWSVSGDFLGKNAVYPFFLRCSLEECFLDMYVHYVILKRNLLRTFWHLVQANSCSARWSRDF